MNTTMKAMVQTKQGTADHLELAQVNRPTPKPDEILIKVHSASVTAGDVFVRKLPRLAFLPMSLMGLKYKSTPGHEFAGEVVAIGDSVSKFNIGDAVFGTTSGLSVGANAEYICLPESSKSNVLARKPDNLSFNEAAVIPVGTMAALYLLQQADVQAGQHVLIFGASGSVGSYAVQLAKYFGAEVTAVCSTRNIEMVTSLGADAVIDYTQEDFTQNGKTYDVIFDAVGKTSKKFTANSLIADGHFLSIRSLTKESVGNLILIKSLVEAGHIRPFIDKCYPLEQLAEAHRYVESGRKRGNIVIAIATQSPRETSSLQEAKHHAGL